MTDRSDTPILLKDRYLGQYFAKTPKIIIFGVK